MDEKKIIVEQNGQSKEVTKDDLSSIMQNPDFKVKAVTETDTAKKYKVQQRLYD